MFYFLLGDHRNVVFCLFWEGFGGRCKKYNLNDFFKNVKVITVKTCKVAKNWTARGKCTDSFRLDIFIVFTELYKVFQNGLDQRRNICNFKYTVQSCFKLNSLFATNSWHKQNFVKVFSVVCFYFQFTLRCSWWFCVILFSSRDK